MTIWKRAFCVLLSILVMASISTTALAKTAYGSASTTNGTGKVGDANGYSEHWQYWSQGGSSYEKMRKNGCYVVALSKLMVEAGIKSNSSFNPDDFFEWCCNKGYLNESYQMSTDVGKVIEGYSGIKVTVESTSWSEGYKKTNEKIISLLNDGNYVIVKRRKWNSEKKNWAYHYLYVSKADSTDEVVLFNSQSDVYNENRYYYNKREISTDRTGNLQFKLADYSCKDNIIYIVAVKMNSEPPANGNSSTTASISLNKSSLTMKDNVCVTLNATTTPSGQTVSWKSSNNSVVKVNNGNLEGVKAGNATITASMSYNGKTYTAACNVTVTPSQTICTTHKYTSSGGDYCTVCGHQYESTKTTVNKIMYAAEDEVVVRSAPYAISSNIVKTLKKDDAVKISYSTTNSLDNKWYITSDGYYIYAERLTSTAPKKVCSKHTYTSNGGDICTVCGHQYVPQKSPVNKTMYAAESEVVVRTSPYEHSSSIVKTLKKDDAVTISYSIDNALGNKWYITSDGYYIYAKRLTSTAPKKLCSKHTYTSSGGDYCTVCGYQYTPKKTTVDKTMYAAESEVVVRSAPYAISSNIVKTLKKDDAVKISYSITNSLGNKWYITSDGRYIYAERLTSTAPKKLCSKHTYTSSGGDYCTVCGYQYTPKKTTVNKTMYAIEKEVVVRTSPYEHSSTIVKTLKKGDAVKISYSIENALGNKWYITSNGYYIYAKRLSTKKP